MKDFIILTFFLVILQAIGIGQEKAGQSKELYMHKKSQHTITYSPEVYFGYKYARCINPQLGFGVGVSLGMRSSNFFDEPHEMAKVNLFYRIYLFKKSYLNLGVFAALYDEGDPYQGFEGEIFYGWEHIKIGHGIQLGNYRNSMIPELEAGFEVIATLLILQLNL